MSGHRSRAPRRPELSQHFLRSGALAASLVAHSSVSRDDLVAEIGPGRGLLTYALAQCADRVIAVEIDACLADELQTGSRSNIDVVTGDFLSYPPPSRPHKVFANLPFARTADIIRRVTTTTSLTEAYLVVQREAAGRFAGYPYDCETIRSLSLKPWWHVEIVRRLRRTDFEPVPNADAVLLWLLRRDKPLIQEGEGDTYLRFLNSQLGTAATVRKALRRLFTHNQVRRLARDLRFSLDARPSELSFEQWLGIYRFLAIDR